MIVSKRLCLLLAAGLLTVPTLAGSPAGAQPLPPCTITFDDACPNTQLICGARFTGGMGCVVEGLLFCYDTGEFSYKVPAGSRARIRLSGDLNELVVFFAHRGAGTMGTMRFFDINGLQVGQPLRTNGDCGMFMPERQTVTFPTPVRTIDVRAGTADVYIDTFEVNPAE